MTGSAAVAINAARGASEASGQDAGTTLLYVMVAIAAVIVLALLLEWARLSVGPKDTP